MASITVSFTLHDDNGNVTQTGMQMFDLQNPEIVGEIGTVIEIKHDKTAQIVDFVGGRPRNRKSPSA